MRNLKEQEGSCNQHCAQTEYQYPIYRQPCTFLKYRYKICSPKNIRAQLIKIKARCNFFFKTIWRQCKSVQNFFCSHFIATGQHISVRSNHKFEAPRHIMQQLYQWYIFFFTNNFSSTIYINLKTREHKRRNPPLCSINSLFSPFLSSFIFLMKNTEHYFEVHLSSYIKIKGSMNGIPS